MKIEVFSPSHELPYPDIIPGSSGLYIVGFEWIGPRRVPFKSALGWRRFFAIEKLRFPTAVDAAGEDFAVALHGQADLAGGERAAARAE